MDVTLPFLVSFLGTVSMMIRWKTKMDPQEINMTHETKT